MKLASELEAANREADETDQAVELAREEHEGWKEKLKEAKTNRRSNDSWSRMKPRGRRFS
ncbi:hypothetical protein BY996DRAFT_6477058 [Phakopsora pachyrhizi]|nr:hypothetical protein BY996DRAFT_6477058 [Phakopsora pachyrhizi]